MDYNKLWLFGIFWQKTKLTMSNIKQGLPLIQFNTVQFGKKKNL